MITVAICTYNRCESLWRTLASLADQTSINWSQVEVIVVDNNCTDNTASVVSSFADRIPLRRVLESSQGLANARNRALAEFRGELIIFTDDDVLLDPEWLVAYRDAFAAFPDAGFGGGSLRPLWSEGPPDWFRGEHLEFIDDIIGWYELSPTTRYLELGEAGPFGASFAVRRDFVKRLGPFKADLGMRGSNLGRGEETEYFLRARRIGAKGIFIGKALCHHAVELHRLRVGALYRYGIASGVAHRVIVDPQARGSLLGAAVYLVRGLYQLALRRGDRFRQCVVNAGVQVGLRRSGPV